MFVVDITYTRPIAEIEAKTAEHRAWLDSHMASGLLLMTGPKVPRTGGILIARGGQTEAELAAILAEDPFQIADLADYVITEFAAGKINPALTGLTG
ncbi:YciI family protein [soil metagenome]